MTKRVKKQRNHGFSLVETLAVVAILVILLSLSAVAAAYYRDYLKITELDNAAREIYMAAENRAVLLNSGGQLDGVLGVAPLAEGGTPAQPIHISKSDAAEKGLLTAGAIDPALLNGDFYIFYNPASGAVTDVFYAEKDILYMGLSDPIDFLTLWSKKSRDDRMRPGDVGPMLGYYGGEQAERENYTPLPAPEVMVEVENADRLTVKVTFSIPEAARKLMGGYDEAKLNTNTHRTVTLSYPDQDPITLYSSSGGSSDASSPYYPIITSPYNERVIFRQETIASGKVVYTWVLDELDTNPAQDNGRHFWQLFTALDSVPVCGKDFTVTAEIELFAPGRRSTSASGSDTGNSLFAERSGGDTARLENLRHLQNLDNKTSAAAGKTSAMLLKDIECHGKQPGEPYGLYAFRPIDNEELRSFDGGWTVEDGKNRRNEITNLLVTNDSAQGKSGAGLFAKTPNSSTANPVKFTGVHLVDAEVTAAKPAGALVGCAGAGNEFRDILVTGSRVTCTDNNSATAAAGGVVGGGNSEAAMATGGVKYFSAKDQKFQQVRTVNTFAACAAGAAGGIAGRISGASNCTSCQAYWEPEEGQLDLRGLLGSSTTQYEYPITGDYAGGLVGHFDRTNNATQGADTFTIERSFASTLVKGTTYTAGLLGGSRSVIITVKNSYTDCYLAGGRAAGLIGNTSNTTTLQNCYAAGFIQMEGTEAAAGLCLGAVKVAAENAYSAMSYPGISKDSSVFPLVQEIDDGSGRFKNSYYLAESIPSRDPADSMEKSYNDMSDKQFLSVMGGLFEFKGYRTGTESQNTNPYNLQEKQNLTKYSFPGLKGLPHYGDWAAYFKEPSLVYYEKDSTGKIGFSGGNARELIGKLEDSQNITIKTDGYAVALMEKDLPKSGSFQVTYTYLGKNGEKAALGPYTYVNRAPSGPNETRLLSATWTRQEGGEAVPDRYYLAPLPTELVIGALTGTAGGKNFQALTSQDFYLYLRFETDIPLENANNLPASGEYFYNPHFAETVKPFVPAEDGAPFIDWDGEWKDRYQDNQPPYAPEKTAEAVKTYITQALTPGTAPVSVSVRTPRHFFHLSKYADYYNNARLSFQQGMRLDGDKDIYTGYRDVEGYSLLRYDERDFQLQTPIGTQARPFLGSYNGNSLAIRRVAFEIPENDRNRVCAGLFGSSGGTLENIVYSLDPSDTERPEGGETPRKPRSIIFYSSEKDTYLGALAGLNTLTGKIVNCAVDSVNLTTQIYTTRIYIGGLCGMNAGLVQNSAAESAYLHVDASNYGSAYAGGLAGSNSGQISASYAVGRLAALAAQDNAPVFLGGFVGQNSGSISNSYSAMDLKTDGVNAKAYGFCAFSNGGRQSGTYYLNNGNFSHRGEEFLAKYDEGEGDAAVSLTYVQLTAKDSPVSGMGKVAVQEGQQEENVFPYPTGVRNSGAFTHYGDWPKPLKLGNMGVYYWEELRIPGKAPSYHVSLLAVDPGDTEESPKTVVKLSTLSTAHDEGGEVTRFGYGIYNKKGVTVILEDTPLPLLYSDGGGAGTVFDSKKFRALEQEKETAGPSSPAGLNKQVDEALAKLMSYELDQEGKTQFQFHSFHSYGLDSRLGGLYPDSNPSTPNGTLTLFEGGDQDIKVTFALNPLFAGALAMEKRDGGGWDIAKDVPQFTSSSREAGDWWKPVTVWTLAGDTPGVEENPYGIRSITQLQLIDWNNVNRDTNTVLELKGTGAHGIASFPYLSSGGDTGKYHWKQSYDIKGERAADGAYKTYSPIAEYYDTTNTDENRGYLDGWFGGVYDGNSYVLENVNIQGSTASCSGLFGVVYNGILKNIVLYSSTGESFVKSVFDKDTSSQWYAIGALAGMAASHDENGKPGQTAVVNCAVSGYQIEAKTYTAKADKIWGGVGVGGLLGLSNMSLSGCASSAEIVLQNGTVANDNIRTGGLVGSCQGSIQNCYAGGSISLDENSDIQIEEKGIYIGGIVGGSYMKPLQIGNNSNLTIGFIDDPSTGGADPTKGWTDNRLINCYSFVQLPDLKAHSAIKGLYAVGGTGEINPSGTFDNTKNHGTTTYENCYFLADEVLVNYSGDAKTFLDNAAERKAKTDLRTQAGKPVINTSYEVGSGYNLNNPILTANSRIREIGGSDFYSASLYYPANLPIEAGLPLFQLQGNRYMFRGWMVYRVSGVGDTAEKRFDWVYYYTTDPDYFRQPGGCYCDAAGLTYEQLAGQQTNIPGKAPDLDIYQLLNAGKDEAEDAMFRPVTTETEEGVAVPGKYSYPPADAPQLRDRDYPFPTILVKDEGKYHVHYGDWPLKGFRRQTLFDAEGKFTLLGGSPIEIDLFVNGSAPYQEHLVLTEGVGKGGRWSFEWDSVKKAEEEGGDAPAVKTIAEVKEPELLSDGQILNEQEKGKPYYRLTLSPLRDGTDILHITYTDQAGLAYSLSVTVHITAAVELRPSRLFLFPSDTVEIAVKATDKAGRPMDERLENGKLVLKGDPNCGSTGYLTARTLTAEAAGDKLPSVLFTTAVPPEALTENLTLGANADFTYTVTTPDPDNPDNPKVQEYGGGAGGDIRVDVIQPWEIQFPEPGDGGAPLTCVISFPSSLSIPESAQGEGDVLLFEIRNAAVEDMANKPALTKQTNGDGTAYTLTYGPDVTSIPPTRLSITLVMTSQDHKLIPENEPQTHVLTLTVEQETPADPPENLPVGQGMEALPPEEQPLLKKPSEGEAPEEETPEGDSPADEPLPETP